MFAYVFVGVCLGRLIYSCVLIVITTETLAVMMLLMMGG